MPSDEAGRRLHPFTVLFSALSTARAFILPAVVGGASAAGGGDVGRIITWTLAFLSLPALAYAAAWYLTFRYRLTDDELVLDSGVLSRRRRVIPLARVQNIDVRASALQRLCGVVELRVETAGGGETEAVLRVVGRREGAALQAELAAGRRAALARRNAEAAPAHAEPEPAAEPLARLSVGDLVLAGATANEAGLVAAGLAGALQIAEELPVRLPRPEFDPGAALPVAGPGGIVLAVAAAAVFFLMLGWLFSIVGAVVGYHGFTLERAGRELRKRYGLLARREGLVPLERVQAVRVEESVLRRPLGLAALKVETAGGGPRDRQRGGAEAFLPLSRAAEVPALVRAVFGDLEYAALRFHPVHPRARRRAFVRYTVPLLAAAATVGLFVHSTGFALAALTPLAFLAAHLHYRNLGYALAPGYVACRAGFLNRITWLIPDRKLQTAHLLESPFQRLHGLSSIVVDTAAGGRAGEASIVDVAWADAADLLEELARRAAAPTGAGRTAA